jgi:uncharacterized membrane protein
MLYLIASHLSDTQLSLFVVFLIAAVSVISAARIFLRNKIKESPLETLNRKFSNGEIESYEFEQRKRQLQKEEDLKLRSFFLSRV